MIAIKPDVSIIIVNYNTADLTCNCIESIKDKTHEISYEIIVVDNCSNDKSISIIKHKYPEVILVSSNINLGFGKANNLAAKYANGKYLFFLNSDTVLMNNAISILEEYAEEHYCRTGIIGGYMRHVDGSAANSVGTFPTYSRYLLARIIGPFIGRFKKYAKKDEREKDIKADAVVGADMFMRRDVFERLKGFDPRFFMYFEETDLALRVKRLGLECHIIPGPMIIHLEGGSTKIKISSRIMMERSMYLYFAKVRKDRCGLWMFYIIYSIVLGSIASVPFGLKGIRLYWNALINEFPSIINGNIIKYK